MQLLNENNAWQRSVRVTFQKLPERNRKVGNNFHYLSLHKTDMCSFNSLGQLELENLELRPIMRTTSDEGIKEKDLPVLSFRCNK